MANPQSPVAAAFPVPPPAFSLPWGTVVNGKVMLDPAAMEFLQWLWAAVQGGGGLIDLSLMGVTQPAAAVAAAEEATGADSRALIVMGSLKADVAALRQSIADVIELALQRPSALGASGGSGPGGSTGQVQYNRAGAFGGFTVGGDATLDTSTGALTLAATGVVAGSYTNANVQVDAKGRVISISNGAGAGGTVTSVGLAAPAIFTVTGSPVTTAGTLTLALANQPANLFFAGPSSGAAAAPSFRAIVAADLPASGVVAGAYTNANVTVDAYGRVIAATSGTGRIVGFILNTGAVGTSVAPRQIAPAAGSVTACKVVVNSADSVTDLTFRILKNGVDIFSANPTITHGTAAGTLVTITSLTSSPLSVTADDIFSLDVLAGTSNWQATILLVNTGGSGAGVIGFALNSGAAGVSVAPRMIAAGAGSLTKCKLVVNASDAAADLTFKIKQNGVDVFLIDPTVTHGAAAGTLFTYTNLTSNPLPVAADDIFSIDITAGSANWSVTIQLE